MIIGIDASRANRSHKSGTEWYSYYVIRQLARLDKDNQYILYSDSPLTGGLINLNSTERSEDERVVFEDGYQILKSPYNNFKGKVLKWPWKYFWTQGRLSLEMIFSSPDVLFIPAHALPIFHPRRSVVTIHDIGFRREGILYEKSAIGREGSYRHRLIDIFVRLLTFGAYGANSFDYLDWSTHFSLEHAKFIIAISEFTKRELIEVYEAKEKKIKVIYNGYNSDLFKPLANRELAEKALAAYGIKEPYIFYVGRLEKKKNIATLIEAFYFFKKRHPELDHKLYLIGDASYGFDDIKYSIHEFGLENDVIATGWVAEKDLPYIFAIADIFVFPSNYEGFGIPLLQAMATNTPIAASNAASIPEISGNAALLFDPSNPEKMADALASIIEDKSIRENLIKAGNQRVKDFSWERCAREILVLIKSL